MVNRLAEEYAHRVRWISSQLAAMADADGRVALVEIRAVIAQHYLCSPLAIDRYLRTLTEARIISQEDSTWLLFNGKLKETKK